jgi:hypothetical protein
MVLWIQASSDVNQVGELLAFKVTTGNVNNRTPVKD